MDSSWKLGLTDKFGTFSAFCERRLVFELSSLPSPPAAVSALVHSIVEIAGRKGKGFITCGDFHKALSAVGVQLSLREVELVASGFASNGEGGINADELCDAIKTLLFQLREEYMQAENTMRTRGLAAKAALEEENETENILISICEGILECERSCGVDIRTYLSQSSQVIFESILRPFQFFDENRDKKVSYEDYCNSLYKLGARLPPQDLHNVAKRFSSKLDYPARSSTNIHINSIKSVFDESEDVLDAVRDRKLLGTLRGRAAADPSFQNWLATQSLNEYHSDAPSRGVGLEGYREELGPSVDYVPLAQRITEIMEGLFEELKKDPAYRHDDRSPFKGLLQVPWFFRDFPIVECLLSQLEKMSSGERRRTLMTLQYCFANADERNCGEVDGFAVVESLVTAGFKLLREDRVRILRAVEELGGRVDYGELCQVLIRSCADWTESERVVVFKILRAMGVTVYERRTWLAMLRQELTLADAHQAQHGNAFSRESMAFSIESSYKKKLQAAEYDVEDRGLPPSTFLRCLRNCGVELSVEEEAILLDCLDMERLAEQSAGRVHTYAVSNRTNWSVPLIYYKSFLSYCSRHCGHWSDISPEIAEALKHTLTTVTNPKQALQEFLDLLQSFDELGSGEISARSFLVACHRSRLLTNFDEGSVQTLSKVLVADGGGNINYISFILYLQANCFGREVPSSGGLPPLALQLIEAATDAFGTLLPLRNWLVRNSDATESGVITFKELVELLREFSIQYKPDDLEAFLLDVKSSSRYLAKEKADRGGSVAFKSQDKLKIEALPASALIQHLLNLRGPWTHYHPKLAERIYKLLSISGANRFTPQGGEKRIDPASLGKTATQPESMSFSHTFRGVESAAAKLALTRLNAFADVGSVTSESDAKDATSEAFFSRHSVLHRTGRFVPREVFSQVMRGVGIPLTDEDTLAVADATDTGVAARNVSCDVLLDVLGLSVKSSAIDSEHSVGESVLQESGMVVDTRRHPSLRAMTKAGLFALKHLQDMIWTSGKRYDRTPLEWISDVRAVFRGFDLSDSGYITTEDFSLALQLLNANVSTGILRDIPLIPDGPGMVPYKELLEIVLQSPKDAATRLYGDDDELELETADEKEIFLESPLKAKERKKPSPVLSLIHVVRKNLYEFITADDTLEKAWVNMLKAFKRFDPDETNLISPRDFCLAVAVLLDKDEVLLTREDWQEVIEFYAIKPPLNSSGGIAKRGTTQVDYMSFCDNVLDSSELSKIRWSSAHIDLSKRTSRQGTNKGSGHNASKGVKHLSTATSKKFGLSLRAEDENLPENRLRSDPLAGVVGQQIDVVPQRMSSNGNCSSSRGSSRTRPESAPRAGRHHSYYSDADTQRQSNSSIKYATTGFRDRHFFGNSSLREDADDFFPPPKEHRLHNTWSFEHHSRARSPSPSRSRQLRASTQGQQSRTVSSLRKDNNLLRSPSPPSEQRRRYTISPATSPERLQQTKAQFPVENYCLNDQYSDRYAHGNRRNVYGSRKW